MDDKKTDQEHKSSVANGKRHSVPLILLFAGLITVLLGATIALGTLRAHVKPTNYAQDLPASPSTSPSLSPSPINSSSPSPSPEASTTPAPEASSTPVSTSQNKAVPILMYHYIRDFNDPKDKVGIGLSVNPTLFAQQLSQIKALGYETVTFKELSDGARAAKPIIITFDDGYDDAYTAALPALQKEGMKGVFYLVSGFLDQSRYITKDQAKALDAAGMEIGSHTIDHKDLAAMNRAMQLTELSQSKKDLELLIGKPVTAFCYPAGRYNQETVSLAKQVGYTTATTTKPGLARTTDFTDKPYELVRVRMTSGTDINKVLGSKK